MTTVNQIATERKHGAVQFSQFPYAPDSWSPRVAQVAAQAEGIFLTDAHWEVVHGLQEYFARHEPREHNLREIHDALDERFHARGGMKYLYALFPGGPVAQGCRIAGLPVPFLAVDQGFGSVM